MMVLAVLSFGATRILATLYSRLLSRHSRRIKATLVRAGPHDRTDGIGVGLKAPVLDSLLEDRRRAGESAVLHRSERNFAAWSMTVAGFLVELPRSWRMLKARPVGSALFYHPSPKP